MGQKKKKNSKRLLTWVTSSTATSIKLLYKEGLSISEIAYELEIPKKRVQEVVLFYEVVSDNLTFVCYGTKAEAYYEKDFPQIPKYSAKSLRGEELEIYCSLKPWDSHRLMFKLEET